MSPISARYRTIDIADNLSDLASCNQYSINLRLMKLPLQLVLSSCKGCTCGQQAFPPRLNCDRPSIPLQLPLQSTTRWRYGDGVRLTRPVPRFSSLNLHTATDPAPEPQRAVKGEIPPIADSALRAGFRLCLRFACVKASSDSCACGSCRVSSWFLGLLFLFFFLAIAI